MLNSLESKDIKNIKVIAAQLGDIPSSYYGGVTAKEAFSKHADRDYYQYLGRIDIPAIKNFNSDRIIKLTKKAIKRSADIIVFPELSLTGFFPYLYISDKKFLLKFFETKDSISGFIKELAKLSKLGSISISFGFAEYIKDSNEYFNTSALVNPDGTVNYYRKTHIPGFDNPKQTDMLFQFEKNIFKPSEEGYPVFPKSINGTDVNVGMIICHDRRYNTPFVSMGLKDVGIILNGYNTPLNLSFANKLDDYVYKFHYLPLQSQAISEGTFIISVARAGESYGVEQIAGTCIISPFGEILANTETLSEELVEANLDLNMCNQVKAQKYWGTRSRPDALIKDFIENGIATDAMIEYLYQKHGFDNIIACFESKRVENRPHVVAE